MSYNVLKKSIAFSTAITILSSFAVYAEQEENTEIIQFSPYKIAAKTETRVNADFATTNNMDLTSAKWENGLLRGHTTNAYNGGTYLYCQCAAGKGVNLEITLHDIRTGIYTFNQYVVDSSGTDNLKITVLSAGTENTYTINTNDSALKGSFAEVGEGIELSGDVTISYSVSAEDKNYLRLDEVQLVLTGEAEPTPTPSATSTPTASPTPTSTPILPTELPEDISQSTVSDIKLTGQFVEAEGLEGFAVDGKCDVSYTFNSVNDAKDSGAVIKWYKSLTADGEYTVVDGATGGSYVFPNELGGYYVKAGVSVLTDENKMTVEEFSQPMQVKYRLAFYDDFNYTATNGEDQELIKHGWTSDKTIRILGSPTIYCARVPENIRVEDGKLKIITRKEHLDKYDDIDIPGHPHTWTTGMVWTSEEYGPYGVYDASYKLTRATGLNQSFWANVRGTQTVERGFIEMDFNEGHYPYEIATNLHRGTGTGTVTAQNSIKHYPFGNSEGSETLADNFNRYTGMLKPNNESYTWDSAQNSDTYQVFFNNELLRKTRSIQYVPSPVSIYFSVAVYPGSFAGPLVDEEADGSIMEADWVAYYQFLGTTKADLEAEIENAQKYVDDAVIGTENGQYSEESVNELKESIETAKLVLAQNPDSETLKNAYDALKAAEDAFVRSVVGGYYVHVESITFEERDVSMLIEKTKQLNVVFNPEDANDKTITYSSNNKTVAEVDANGVVTAKTPGTAVITATSKDGGKQAQCTVTVKNLPENQVFYEVEGGKLIFDKTSQRIIDYVGSPTEIAIPSRIEDVKVLEIATNTFKNLTSLRELRIKKGMESIGDWAFVGCTSLENVQLPDSLISINTASFQGCEKLTELTIPSSVQNIEIGAFSLCNNLKSVTFNGNAPAEVGGYPFGENEDLTIYFYTGAEGFTTPEWKGYNSVQLDGEPIPIPEPEFTEIRITGGRDTAIRGFELEPFKARAYDDIGDELTEIEFTWSVEGNAVIDNGTVTINENAQIGDIVKVKVTGTYNGKTVTAEKIITIEETLIFDFGDEYKQIKPYLPGSMSETEITDGITTTVEVAKSSVYSNVEIMNKDTKIRSGYYPYKDGLPGDFYYLFISGEGKNTLRLPYTARKGETIRVRFAKPNATNNGSTNRTAGNNKLDLTIGDEVYSLKENCDFDKWYTKDFVVDSDTNTITISMGNWSAIAIENIEIIPIVDNSAEISSVNKDGNNVTAEFRSDSGVILITGYDENGNMEEIHIAEKSEWTVGENGYSVNITLNNECETVKCMLWNSLSDMKPLCNSK